jgi:3-methyladenine DNA glycosylase AlkD
MMVMLAVFDKNQPDDVFVNFLALICKFAVDERNYVKKAINWALRRIGQRNSHLLQESRKIAAELEMSTSRSARWIGRDARLKWDKKFLSRIEYQDRA